MGLRIIVSGTASTGKSTLVRDICTRWPSIQPSTFNYRDLLGDKTTHSINTTPELQMKILDGMCEELSKWDKDKSIIMDRGPIDNVAYTLWAYGNGKTGFTEEFVRESVTKCRQAMKNVDLIVFVPITYKDKWDIKPVEDGKRETDLTYIRSIDVIFKHIIQSAKDNDNNFFELNDVPGVLEAFGSREMRLQMLNLYLNPEGNLWGGNVDDQGAGMGDLIQDMINDQKDVVRSEAIGREMKSNMIDFYRAASKLKKGKR